MIYKINNLLNYFFNLYLYDVDVHTMLAKDAKILIIMPKFAKLMQSFDANLKLYYPNSFVETFEDSFKYPHFGHELYHAFKKYFFKDRSHKIELYNIHVKQVFNAIIKKMGNFDYILVIRPDFYPLDALAIFKKYVNKKMVAYQWDGIDRYSGVVPYIESAIFDDFFVFEPKDVKKYPQYNLKFSTNFYFDFPHVQTANIINKRPKIAYFIGSHQVQRYDEVISLAQRLTDLGVHLNFNVNYNEGNEQVLYEQYSIQCHRKGIPYIKNLANVNDADILVDVSMKNVHTGLSLRIFEALYAQKKLITNNPAIKDYEFYHPNNIFLLKDDNLHALEDFLAIAFVPIDEEIIAKYSFHNWLHNILDIDPHQKIPLPKM